MQLTQFTDYSLRVLIYTAARRERRCTVAEVARVFDVSQHHLVKVVHELQQLGYLETYRGRGGGFRLARDPERIGLGNVVRHTEETLAVVECFDGARDGCPLTKACGLKAALHEALTAFLTTLDRYSLADLVAEPKWLARVIALTPKEGRRSA
jgi:Rrf2 family nitric oxide-sensitive transcriptional repressor